MSDFRSVVVSQLPDDSVSIVVKLVSRSAADAYYDRLNTAMRHGWFDIYLDDGRLLPIEE